MADPGYNSNTILTYKGPISLSMVSFMGNYLKNLIKVEHVLLKRIFRIFVELTQNVSYYSAEIIKVDNELSSGVGQFDVIDDGKVITVRTGNVITKPDGVKLSKNINEINSLNENQLRDLKRKTRGQAMIKDVGAHIGLIQTSLLAKCPLYFEITEIDNQHAFFVITVSIEK